jgi:bacterioferritin-associated ferredoxin
MIVCHCNVVTDTDIRKTLADEDPHAPRTPAQAYRCLGCSPNCGRCLVTVRRILADARASACPVGCAVCPATGRGHAADDHHHENTDAPVHLVAAE